VDEASALEDAVQDGGGQVLVVQDLSPLAERLVGDLLPSLLKLGKFTR